MRATVARAPRRGMSLVEIMIALVLVGIVSGVIMRVIMRQQRFYQGANQIMTQRGQLRQATSVLPVDLRSLSSIGADIIVATDSSLEFRMNIGTGIMCDRISGTQIAMPPVDLASEQTLTTLFGYGLPRAGATVFVYNDSTVVGNEEDRWQEFTLSADATTSATPCLFSFATVADAGKKRIVLTLANPGAEPNDPVTGGPVSQYIQLGAPVRIVKRVKYALFQASDGDWYLGYADYDTGSGSYAALSPVSGPYDPYATGSGTASGFLLRYYDVDGAEIAAGADSAGRSRIARVDLIARAKTAAAVRTAGIQNGLSQQYKDSLAVSIMLRNRQ